MRARAEFLRILFDVLEREAVPYCILRNYKSIYEDGSSDIDLIVEQDRLGALQECLAEASQRSGLFLVHQARYVNHSFVYGRQSGGFVRIDVETEVRWRFFPVLSAKAVLGLRRKHEGFYIPHPRHEAVILFVAAIWRGALSDRYRAQLAELYQRIQQQGEIDALKRTFDAAFGSAGSRVAAVLQAIAQDKAGELRFGWLRRSLAFNAFRESPNFQQFVRFVHSDLRRLLHRVIRPPGISLVFVSSAATADEPDRLFERIEFLYPIRKSSRSVAGVPVGEGRRAKLDAAGTVNRWYTMFKGGLFLRFYQVARDEDIPDVIRAHRYWTYPTRAFVCSHNSAGRMWIRHAGSGSPVRTQRLTEPFSPHDHLIEFIAERLENSSGANAEGRIAAEGSPASPNIWPMKSVAFRRLACGAAWLAVIATFSFLSLGFLKMRARAIAEDTLPGLSYAGAANANLAQAFNRTLILLLSHDVFEKGKINLEIKKFSERTTRCLVLYKQSIYAKEDADLFADLLKCRTEYLRAREKTLQLAEQHKTEDAASACQNELLPAYTRYKEAGDKLFDFNMREGRDRGRSIMFLCTAAQCLVAGIAVGIFVIGFVIGLSRRSSRERSITAIRS